MIWINLPSWWAGSPFEQQPKMVEERYWLMEIIINEEITKACLKARLNGAAFLETAPPADGISWQSLADFIQRHSLSFFFYNEVQKGLLPLTVPPGVLAQWKAGIKKTIIYNTLLAQELSEILHGLREISIEPILLKGLALNSLYEDVLARPASDIDLLISWDDYLNVRGFLTDRGFSVVTARDFRGTLQQYIKLQENYCTEIHLQKDLGATSINIDLHWELEGFFDGSPLEALFPLRHYPWHDYLTTDSWNQISFKTLIPEMHFIHLTTHFALHHQYQGAKWLLDLLLFVQCKGDSLNWDFIDGIVQEPDCRKIIGVILRMMVDLGVNLPASVPKWQHFWNGRALPGEFNFFKRRLFSSLSKTDQYLGYLLLPLRFRDKFRVLAYFLFNKNAVILWRGENDSTRLPFLLQPFYILYRVLRDKV